MKGGVYGISEERQGRVPLTRELGESGVPSAGWGGGSSTHPRNTRVNKGGGGLWRNYYPGGGVVPGNSRL